MSEAAGIDRNVGTYFSIEEFQKICEGAVGVDEAARIATELRAKAAEVIRHIDASKISAVCFQPVRGLPALEGVTVMVPTESNS